MDKTWKVKATYNPGRTDTYYIKGKTLYDAFHNYYSVFGTRKLIEIHITEVKQDERSEGISGTDQMAGCAD